MGTTKERKRDDIEKKQMQIEKNPGRRLTLGVKGVGEETKGKKVKTQSLISRIMTIPTVARQKYIMGSIFERINRKY